MAQPKAPGGLVLILSFFSHRLRDRVRAALVWQPQRGPGLGVPSAGRVPLLSQLRAGDLPPFRRVVCDQKGPLSM